MSERDFQRRVGQRFARLVTNAVVASPELWRVFRGLTRRQFDALAPTWDARRPPDAFAALASALDALPNPPARALDIGTGTGKAALTIAERFPEADVQGVDIAARMVEEAKRLTPPNLAGRVHFDVADSAQLPYADGTFDLVSLANMIPFFDEIARLVTPDGSIVVSFSAGPETPIYVPFERLRTELGRRGFADFAEFDAGGGTALLARRPERS
jgi:SAM-dependent methyltransferase